MAICDTAALRSNGAFGSEPLPKESYRRASRQSERRSVKFVRIVSSRRTASMSARRSPSRAASSRSRICGDRFKGASRLGFGAREPHFKVLDRRIERFRRFWRARRLRAFVSSGNPFQTSGGRIEPIVFRPVVFPPRVPIQTGVVGDHFVEPIVKAHAGASGRLHGGVAGPPVHARDIPRHRSIHVLDRRSEAANRRMNGGDAAHQFCRGSW